MSERVEDSDEPRGQFPRTQAELDALIAQERETAFNAGADQALARARTTVPHEFNQPLSLILGYGELIEAAVASGRASLPDDLSGYLGEMVLASRLLAEKINSFGRFATRANYYNFGGFDLIRIEEQQEDTIT